MFFTSRFSKLCPLLFLVLSSSINFSLALPSVSPDRVLRRTGTLPSLSGAAVSMDAGTYPRATLLADGSILAAHTTFSGDENIISIIRSTDGGNSWSTWGTVTEGVGDIDNPFLLQLPSGRILCVFRNHSLVNGVYTYFRITICYSDDNGVTWGYLSQPASDPGPVNGNWEPFLRLSTINTNTIQLYYSRENAANDQDTLMRTSTDGGTTWSLAATITGSGIISRDGMTGVAEYAAGSGHLIIVFESDDTSTGGTGLFTVLSTTSTDDGASWSTTRSLVYSATGTENNAGSPQIVNVGGTFVVSFMTDEDTSLHEWVTGADAKVLTSTDGINWSDKTTIMGVQTNWPGLLTLTDSSFIFMGDNGGAKSQIVTLS